MSFPYKRCETDSLSFKGRPLRSGRHKIHPYPAMLHPLLVDYLINKYAKKGTVIFDPFCGSGVTLLQSAIAGYKSIGFDINPLALLIAKTKTENYCKNDLIEEYLILKRRVIRGKKIDIPNIKNIDYWYSADVVTDLGRIRHELKGNYKFKDFFLVCFAFICRCQSLTRQGEFKRYRISKDTPKENKVFHVFFDHVQSMIETVGTLSDSLVKPAIYLTNSEDKISSQSKYNLVITSPPYGDSNTTVAYGQFCSFGSEWTSDLNLFGKVQYNVDKEGLGKPTEKSLKVSEHEALLKTIANVKKKDPKRANDVFNFFNGYYRAIKNIVGRLKRNGRICFVVGNRTVKGHEIPMDQITASFFTSLDCQFEKNLVRRISNKVMPSKNSPTNQTGAKVNTMHKEYIVVCSKG